MILSGDSIRAANIFEPCEERGTQSDMSYGLGPCCYDIRVHMPAAPVIGYRTVLVPSVGAGVLLVPGQGILLATREKITVPPLAVGFVKDTAPWARRGLLTAQAVVEPGETGHLSVFVTNAGSEDLPILDGDPIARLIFHWLDKLPDLGYN